MAQRNLFIIGRSRLGSEDQLTEMLAYLLEEYPELAREWTARVLGEDCPQGDWSVDTQVVEGSVGRFDLVLEMPGAAYVIVESKLGSPLTDDQLGRYLAFLAARTEPLRALVSLTEHPQPIRQMIISRAEEAQVRFVASRWQDLAGSLGQASGDGLPGEFVRMLIHERLVMPTPLTHRDWDAWNRGSAVAGRLRLILDETQSAIGLLSPGLTPLPRGGGRDERWMYSLLTSESLWLGLGFAANESPKRPESAPIIWAFARDTTLPEDQSRAAARAAARRIPAAGEVFGTCVQISRPAHEVLTADDFRAQVNQATWYVYEVARRLQEEQYLPASLALIEPASAS